MKFNESLVPKPELQQPPSAASAVKGALDDLLNKGKSLLDDASKKSDTTPRKTNDTEKEGGKKDETKKGDPAKESDKKPEPGQKKNDAKKGAEPNKTSGISSGSNEVVQLAAYQAPGEKADEKPADPKKEDPAKPADKASDSKPDDKKTADAQKPDAQKPDAPKPDPAKSGDKTPPTGDKPPANKEAVDKPADKADENPAADPVKESPVDGTKAAEEAKKRHDAEVARVKTDNDRKQKEYQDKLAQGRAKAKDMNNRFADWYYVISEESYKKIRLTRSDVVKKKETEKKPPEGKPELPFPPMGGLN